MHGVLEHFGKFCAAGMWSSHNFGAQACTPCQGPEAPETVRAVWRLVDEYALAESERATLKLLRGLDKHMQHLQHSASLPTNAAEASEAASEGTAAASSGLTEPTFQQAQVAPAQHAVQQTEESHRLYAQQEMQDYTQPQHSRAEPTSACVTSDSMPAAQSRHPLAVGTTGQSSSFARSPSASEQQALSQLGHQQVQLHQHTSPNAVPLTASASQNLFTIETQQQVGRVQVHHLHHHMPADPRCTVTADQAVHIAEPFTAGWSTPSASPLAPPRLVRASGNSRREKLEYRLSQDDIYIPTAAELAAVMQQPGRTAPRWTADVYTYSQHGRPNNPALQRPPADMCWQQHQRGHADLHTRPWSAETHQQQHTLGTAHVSGNCLPPTRLHPNSLQQNGLHGTELQPNGHLQNGLQDYAVEKQRRQTPAVPVKADVSSSTTTTHGVFANPLIGQQVEQRPVQLGQEQSLAQLQHLPMGHGNLPRAQQPDRQGQAQQPRQLPHQPSNMLALMQKADAAQVCP